MLRRTELHLDASSTLRSAVAISTTADQPGHQAAADNRHRQCYRPAELQHIDWRQAAKRNPAGLMRSADKTTDGEGWQNDDRHGRASTGFIERSGTATIG